MDNDKCGSVFLANLSFIEDPNTHFFDLKLETQTDTLLKYFQVLLQLQNYRIFTEFY